MSRKQYTRPFLKWAGGKYRVLDRIRACLPEGRTLIEPFVGSGAVFINTDYDRYVLADINPDLVLVYQTLQQQGLAFIERAESLFTAANNRETRYYRLRTRFNQLEAGEEKAALFLYLNRHGYNGLCRYNQDGGFNVPFGSYLRPYFPRKELHHFWQKSRRARFVCASFEAVMKKARRGQVVYCDPPYVPLSKTASFTSYAKQGFGPVEQQLLADTALGLANRGVPVVISNHQNEVTAKLYRAAKLHSFPVSRSISCVGQKRGQAQELLAVFG